MAEKYFLAEFRELHLELDRIYSKYVAHHSKIAHNKYRNISHTINY